jgi:polyisoprenoid-binding protein YceI
MKLPTSLLALALLAAPLRALEVPLTVDKKQSRIEYIVAAPLGAAFIGSLASYDLDLATDAATGKISRAEIRFRFADLRSGHAKRDQDMRDWQNTEQFPECVFTLIALEQGTSAGRFTARGQLIFHGMTRDLVFPVTITAGENGLIVINGDAKIDVRDFGLPEARRFHVLKTDPVVRLKLHLQASPASPRI